MLLEEFLEPMGMSQVAFAQKIGWSCARLNEFIRKSLRLQTDQTDSIENHKQCSLEVFWVLACSREISRNY